MDEPYRSAEIARFLDKLEGKPVTLYSFQKNLLRAILRGDKLRVR